jgi:hypothetical protein
MPTTYPTTLDVFTNPSTTDPLTSPPHASQHANANDAIHALEVKVGVNGSAVTTSLDYLFSHLAVGQVSGAAPLASPALTGTPTAPTASVGTNTTQLATTAFVLANGGAPAYVQVAERQTSGTASADSSIPGAGFSTRTINTEVSDSGNIVTLTSNQIRLNAGTYVCRVRTTFYDGSNTNTALLRLRDTTNLVTVALGLSATVSAGNQTVIEAYGKFTIAGNTPLEVQLWLSNATANGGQAVNTGESETYTVAEFWKVG